HRLARHSLPPHPGRPPAPRHRSLTSLRTGAEPQIATRIATGLGSLNPLTSVAARSRPPPGTTPTLPPLDFRRTACTRLSRSGPPLSPAAPPRPSGPPAGSSSLR